jgi:phenylacetate-coenzyme A ligase PaaK-like adenylate-forming protein
VAIDLWRAEREGPEGLVQRQAERLSALVAHARVYSPYFRELYSGHAFGPIPLQSLPVTSKPELMARFDDWVTDRRIRLEDVRAFVADPTLSGVRFLDEYFICRSSGTSGHPGIFVVDRAGIAATYACYAVASVGLLRHARWGRMAARRMRQVRVVGTGGHFAGAGLVDLDQHERSQRADRHHVVSVEQPLGDIVEQLNSLDPAILQTYPSALRQLAQEQRAGRLHIFPGLIGTGGETVSIEERHQIAATFGAPVADGYASSECLLLATTCTHQWLHYRNDWMILEPVDVDHQPVEPGEPSDTVLLTDLSNRVQPIIRYDLADSVLVRPDPCECGSTLPAIRVIGRRDDILRFVSGHDIIEVLPLAITASIEEIEGLERVQLIQTSPTVLSVRLSTRESGQAAAVWSAVSHALRAFLDRHNLQDVLLELQDQPPDDLGASGKFHQVIGLDPPLEAATPR